MYAITLTVCDDTLLELYAGEAPATAFTDIAVFLAARGFTRKNPSFYVGDKEVNPVTAVLAVQGLIKEFPWFAGVVLDIRLVRIAQESDLMPVITDAVVRGSLRT
jgi:virulence-associated protein VapD